MFQFPVTANVVTSSVILSTLKIEATCSSETSVITIPTRRHIPEDGIPQIKLDLREIVCVGLDWINLTADRDRWRLF
jgi:hypothetical protein